MKVVVTQKEKRLPEVGEVFCPVFALNIPKQHIAIRIEDSIGLALFPFDTPGKFFYTVSLETGLVGGWYESRDPKDFVIVNPINNGQIFEEKGN